MIVRDIRKMGDGERYFEFTQRLSVSLELSCVLLFDVMMIRYSLTICGYLFFRYLIYYFTMYIKNSLANVVAQWQKYFEFNEITFTI